MEVERRKKKKHSPLHGLDVDASSKRRCLSTAAFDVPRVQRGSREVSSGCVPRFRELSSSSRGLEQIGIWPPPPPPPPPRPVFCFFLRFFDENVAIQARFFFLQTQPNILPSSFGTGDLSPCVARDATIYRRREAAALFLAGCASDEERSDDAASEGITEAGT